MKTLFSAFLLFLIISIVSCGGRSTEGEIELLINEIISEGEDRNMEGVLKFISEDYNDNEGRSKSDIRDLLHSYLNRFRGIVINLLNFRITENSAKEAKVTAEISLSSGIGRAFRKLVRSYGETYRFILELKREGRNWKIMKVSWSYIPIEELYPESLKVLKDLFPATF